MVQGFVAGMIHHMRSLRRMVHCNWIKPVMDEAENERMHLMTFMELSNQRWHQRTKRPLPLSVTYASQHFEQLWIVDASTLEALFRKLKSLESSNLGALGERICAVVDLKTRYSLPLMVLQAGLLFQTKYRSAY